VEAAASYIASGRKPRFRYRPSSGPVLAGSMNLAGTLRLHARGRRGHLLSTSAKSPASSRLAAWYSPPLTS
jgi:hypothetical protein